MDALPDFKPLMLSGLSYDEVIHQMRQTGCAARRLHWCAPLLVMGPRRGLWLDDEGERRQYVPTLSDRACPDWVMVENPAQRAKEAGHGG